MKKTHDIAVKVGTYKKDGQDKARWRTVGCILEGDDGNKVLLLNRDFNPAGVPFKEGSETIMLSMFEPDNKSSAKPAPTTSEVKDEIPF